MAHGSVRSTLCNHDHAVSWAVIVASLNAPLLPTLGLSSRSISVALSVTLTQHVFPFALTPTEPTSAAHPWPHQ